MTDSIDILLEDTHKALNTSVRARDESFEVMYESGVYDNIPRIDPDVEHRKEARAYFKKEKFNLFDKIYDAGNFGNIPQDQNAAKIHRKRAWKEFRKNENKVFARTYINGFFDNIERKDPEEQHRKDAWDHFEAEILVSDEDSDLVKKVAPEYRSMRKNQGSMERAFGVAAGGLVLMAGAYTFDVPEDSLRAIGNLALPTAFAGLLAAFYASQRRAR